MVFLKCPSILFVDVSQCHIQKCDEGDEQTTGSNFRHFRHNDSNRELRKTEPFLQFGSHKTHRTPEWSMKSSVAREPQGGIRNTEYQEMYVNRDESK